jgi:hypothetical protein
MSDISIFHATCNEVPEELEEQTTDLEKVLDSCKKYMQEWGVSAKTLVNDLGLIL